VETAPYMRSPHYQGDIMVYAIPCQTDAHDLLLFLFGTIPEYEENSYMLLDTKKSGNNRLVKEDELYNEDGTMYAIDDLVIIVM
jgi:hypothetical protein